MKYPARLLSTEEETAAAFRPHWMAIVLPALITALCVAAIIVVAIQVKAPAVWFAVGGILLLWLIAALPRWIKWWFTHYVVTNERLIVRRGFIARQGKEIPLEGVKHAAFHHNATE